MTNEHAKHENIVTSNYRYLADCLGRLKHNSNRHLSCGMCLNISYNISSFLHAENVKNGSVVNCHIMKSCGIMVKSSYTYVSKRLFLYNYIFNKHEYLNWDKWFYLVHKMLKVCQIFVESTAKIVWDPIQISFIQVMGTDAELKYTLLSSHFLQSDVSYTGWFSENLLIHSWPYFFTIWTIWIQGLIIKLIRTNSMYFFYTIWIFVVIFVSDIRNIRPLYLS